MSKQSDRDRDKTFNEKFKQFFKSLNKTGLSRSRSDESIVLTEELVTELGPKSSYVTRVKAIKDFAELSKYRRLENHAVETLWALLRDLMLPKIPMDTRHLVLGLFENICKSQKEQPAFLRAEFFAFIRLYEIVDDAGPRFQFLKALTENGKDMACFNEKIGPFILSWMPNTQTGSVSTKDFMTFLVNVIKFNQTFLDIEVLCGIIQNVCFICCTCQIKEDILECLQVLAAVVCYPSLPPASLSNFLATLCRTVNVEILCQPSWKIVRDLLGTHLGHSALLTMCQFMETPDQSEDDVAVTRGSVFFVGVALWGARTVRSLKYTPATVLSSFKMALDRKHPLVQFEVIMRIQDLVKNRGDCLKSIGWDLMLTMVEQVAERQPPRGGDELRQHQSILKAVNDALDTLEVAIDSSIFCGSVEKFYDVTDKCVRFRPEASIDKLLQYKKKKFLRSSKPTWLNNLINFGDRHFRLETRPEVKVKALAHMADVCMERRDTHGEDLIDKVILPYLRSLETENDCRVREQGVKFIVDFMMESCSKKCHELLNILERVVNRPFDAGFGGDLVLIFSESEVIDIFSAIHGLVRLLEKKIYCLPSSIAIMTYKIIVRHLGNHYKKPSTLAECHSLRYMIFECFFRIRANSLYHLGFPDPAVGVVTSYSPFLAVDHRDGEIIQGENSMATPIPITTSPPSDSPNYLYNPSVTFISFSLACQLVVSSLKHEKDWRVLDIIMRQVPAILENKALILSKNGNDIDVLANTLCTIMMDRSLAYPNSLRNVPPTFQKSEFRIYLYPIVAALVSYHNYLESTVQQKIVKCLEYGLTSRNCKTCILSLSTCILEMKDTMHKLLPEVLLSLSKISPKVLIAISVLEFLSTLIHLPRVFASFVQDQYMSIFAIALPYTNPFKFDQYTVSLAHHVIAMWFLKCRLSFRKGFVSYIIKGLKQNVWAPFDEENRRNAIELQNEDSTNRKRSSSLTEQTQKRRERAASGHMAQAPPVPRLNSKTAQLRPNKDLSVADKAAMKVFHEELTETCVDLLARYAFADCSALPTRFPSSEFLLKGGQSNSWLMDYKIITVTTSGCSQKQLKDGLCDKCTSFCKPKPAPANPTSGGDSLSLLNSAEPGDTSSDGALRRRHRSAYASSPTGHQSSDGFDTGANETSKSSTAKDDLHLENRLHLTLRRRSISGVDDENISQHSSPNSGQSSNFQMSEHMLCTCWCQGWAEIHIRRPTGNTSWMMRVQNNLGNSTSGDVAVRELSAMYLRSMNLQHQSSTTPLHDESATPPVFNSPSLLHSIAGQTPATSSADNVSDNCGQSELQELSSSTPGSPSKSTDSSQRPVQNLVSSMDTEDPSDLSPGKHPVRRSNSSPEMSDSWKNPFTKQHDQIQEQDEEEGSSAGANSLKLNEKKQATGGDDAVTKPVEAKESINIPSPKIGNTSPYRRSHEAIPEEAHNRDTHLPLATVKERRDSLGAESPENLMPLKRDRTATITVMSPAIRNKGVRRFLSTGSDNFIRRDRDFPDSRSGSATESTVRSGMHPGFVFLQLCAQGIFGQGAKPLLLPSDLEGSLRILDFIPPYETHKIGVVYVGAGQASNETAILQNMNGSTRYRDFLQGLGSLIKLGEVDSQKTYIGGLSRDSSVDGEFAYIWRDDIMQVIFHVATLMPNKPTDLAGNGKKLHIGNDYVVIVYNNSGQEYDISTIKGQFIYACVVIQPLDHKTNRIIVQAKPVLSDHIGHTEPKIVSDQNLAVMARQLALHSNLASLIFQQRDRPEPYASNWLERLRSIKRLRTKLMKELGTNSEDSHDSIPPTSSQMSQAKSAFIVDDFTDYV